MEEKNLNIFSLPSIKRIENSSLAEPLCQQRVIDYKVQKIMHNAYYPK